MQQTQNPQAAVNELPEIIVNGIRITQSELADELQYHPADSLADAIQQAGQALVIKSLLIEQLDGQPLPGAEQEQAISALLEKNVNPDPVTDQECRQYFNSNHERFATAPLMQVQHILLAAAKDDINTRLKQKTKAEELLEQLKTEPTRFTELAASISDCPSKAEGGMLGQISKGQTVPEFERQLFRLDKGLHYAPIESRYGYHLVNVIDKVDGRSMAYEQCADRVHNLLSQRRYQQAVKDYVTTLVMDAHVEGFQLQH